MADAAEQEKGHGDNSISEHGHQTQIFERPTGLKGLYYHPITQVCVYIYNIYIFHLHIPVDISMVFFYFFV